MCKKTGFGDFVSIRFTFAIAGNAAATTTTTTATCRI